MGLAIFPYFVVLVRSLAGARDSALAAKPFKIPLSETLHDENVPAVNNFAPWVTAAVLLVVVAYSMPLREIAKSHIPGAVGYHPDSPIAVETQH